MCSGKSPESEDEKVMLEEIGKKLAPLAHLLARFFLAEEEDIEEAVGGIGVAAMDKPKESEPSNMVLQSWQEFSKRVSVGKKHAAPSTWHETLPLARDTHLDNILSDLSAKLLGHRTLQGVDLDIRTTLVWGPGRVFLQLLAIQYQLGEELRLDGSLLKDLINELVLAPSHSNIADALQLMWEALDPLDLKQQYGWSNDEFLNRQATFNDRHTIYDPNIEPPKYVRAAMHIDNIGTQPKLCPPPPPPKSTRKRKAEVSCGHEPRRSTRHKTATLDIPSHGQE